jgi:hypothetical protein
MNLLHHFAAVNPIAFLVIGWFVCAAFYFWVLWMLRNSRRTHEEFERELRRPGGMYD